MLRRALPSLFCAFALVASAHGQDVFVPRELKATAVNPPKTKEVIRRAEPATATETKAPAKETAAKTEPSKPKAAKTETAPAKTEKAVVKEKPAPAKDQKPAVVADHFAHEIVERPARFPAQR